MPLFESHGQRLVQPVLEHFVGLLQVRFVLPREHRPTIKRSTDIAVRPMPQDTLRDDFGPPLLGCILLPRVKCDR